jgi:hypothetical protein
MFLDMDDDAVELSEQAEEILFKIAEAIGILVTEEEALVLEKFLEGDSLSEAANIVRLNKTAKMASLVTRSALVLSQQGNDPLFKKYSRAASAKRQFRDLIMKKYQGRALGTARKILANAGKRNLVQISQSPSSFSNPETKKI